jgi:hypothetical protein
MVAEWLFKVAALRVSPPAVGAQQSMEAFVEFGYNHQCIVDSLSSPSRNGGRYE